MSVKLSILKKIMLLSASLTMILPAIGLSQTSEKEISSYGFTVYNNVDTTLINQYKDLKAGWVRIATQWNDIETAPGVYNWGKLDQAVALANANNIRVDFPIWRAPSFRASLVCSDDNNVLFGPNTSNTDYYPTVEDMVAHPVKTQK